MTITTDPATRDGVQRINPSTWSAAFGYDQAQLRAAPTRVLTLAGQGAVDAGGRLLHAGDVAAQIATSMQNVEDLLTRAGMTWADVTRMTVYTTDMDATFAGYGAIAGRLAAAGATPPATLLGVARLALPGMAVEIEVTAAR
ncbi:RidA family protein [Jatrophihabitans fulvus]